MMINGNLVLKITEKTNIEKAIEHIDLLHRGDDRYIFLFQKFKNDKKFHRGYKIEELKNKIRNGSITLETDTYISVNSFYIPKRSSDCIRQLRSFFVDIDNHDVEKISDFEYDSLLFTLQNDYFGTKIPEPSMIMRTGRGIQLYFLINNAPKQLINIWNKVENLILEEFKNFDILGYKVDPGVKDVVRVLRLEGSTNTKSNTVTTLDYENSSYKTNTIAELFESYFPLYVTGAEKQKYEAKREAIKQKRETKKVTKTTKIIDMNRTLFSLNRTRLWDLNTLWNNRDGNFKNMRNKFLFLFSYFSFLNKNDETLILDKLKYFRDNFIIEEDKISDAQLNSTLKLTKEKADNWKNTKSKTTEVGNNYYVFKNETIIKWLNISSLEQEKMKSIIGKEEKNKREIKRSKKNRDIIRTKKIENETTKQQKINKEKEEILKLKTEGLSNVEISKRLNIPRTTVIRRQAN